MNKNSNKLDAVAKCPKPGKVLNGLNARQSEIFEEIPLKDSFKLFDGLCFLEM